jgi:hypothetical protein
MLSSVFDSSVCTGFDFNYLKIGRTERAKTFLRHLNKKKCCKKFYLEQAPLERLIAPLFCTAQTKQNDDFLHERGWLSN